MVRLIACKTLLYIKKYANHKEETKNPLQKRIMALTTKNKLVVNTVFINITLADEN